MTGTTIDLTQDDIRFLLSQTARDYIAFVEHDVAGRLRPDEKADLAYMRSVRQKLRDALHVQP